MVSFSLFRVSLLGTLPFLTSAAFRAASPIKSSAMALPLALRQTLCGPAEFACADGTGCCDIGTRCSVTEAGIPVCIVPKCDPGVLPCDEGPISGICCPTGSTCAFSTCTAAMATPSFPTPDDPVPSVPATTSTVITSTSNDPPETSSAQSSGTTVGSTRTSDSGVAPTPTGSQPPAFTGAAGRLDGGWKSVLGGIVGVLGVII